MLRIVLHTIIAGRYMLQDVKNLIFHMLCVLSDLHMHTEQNLKLIEVKTLSNFQFSKCPET